MSSVSLQLIRRSFRSPLCRCRLHQANLRAATKSAGVLRCYSSEPLPAPNAEGEKQYSQKIRQIVDDISQLTLLEVADLNELLKKTLKIQDAPVMAVGAAPVAQEAKEEEEEAVAAPQKTSFNVKLTGFDADKKIGLIKEIKNLIPGTNLVQAKKFVESVPVVVKSDLVKDEAEQLQKALEKVGGKCVIE